MLEEVINKLNEIPRSEEYRDEIIEKSLLILAVLANDKTKQKEDIFKALEYLLSNDDEIPDEVPFIGYVDDAEYINEVFLKYKPLMGPEEYSLKNNWLQLLA